MGALHRIEFQGQSYRSVRALATAHNVDHATFQARLKRGLSLAEALAPPAPRGERGPMAEVLGVGFASQKAACAAHKANYNTVKDRMRRLSLTFEQALLMNPAVAPIQKKCVAHGVLRWTYWARKRRGWTEEQALGIEGPPRADPKPRLARILRFQYALTIERYEALLAQHDGCCWICLQEANPPCVDHCHRTQKVRGILCRGCNTAIGRMGDDPSLLRAAAAYLER